MAPDEEDRPSGHSVPDYRGLPEGHLILTYRGDSLPWPSIASFLAAGLAGDARLVYLFDRTSRSDVERRLRESSLDVDALLSSGQLQVEPAEEHYVPGGRFEPARRIEDARRALEAATRDGFSGLRVAGEMGWTADRDIPVETLTDYERRVDELMSREAIEGLCIYPADRFESPVLEALDVLHDEHLRGHANGASAGVRDGEWASDAEHVSRETTFRALSIPLLHVRWPEGLIQACNAAAVSYTGYDRAELVGSVVDRILPDEDEAEGFRRRCRRALQGEEPPRFSFPIRRVDGEPLPTEHEVIPLTDPTSGEPGQALLVMRESTEE